MRERLSVVMQFFRRVIKGGVIESYYAAHPRRNYLATATCNDVPRLPALYSCGLVFVIGASMAVVAGESF